MTALERALTEPMLTFSPWTAARGVLEVGATAMWLLSGPDPEARLARGLTLRLSYLHDELAFAQDGARHGEGGNDLVEAPTNIQSRIQHLVEVARKNAIGEKKNRRSELIGFGAYTMPSVTQLVQDAFGDVAVYRLMSAVAHNRSWATLSASLRANNSRTAVTQHISPTSFLFLVLHSLDWFARPVWAFFTFNSWNRDPLVEILETEFDRAEVVPAWRFWRS